MKKTCLILFVILLVYVLAIPSYACTSFAVYSKNVYYGMNFDYPDVNFRFNISHNGNERIFYYDFEWEKGVYQPGTGMNTNGLFASAQIMEPMRYNKFMPDEEVINLPEFSFQSLNNYNTVKDIKKYLNDKRFISAYARYTLHDIFADKHGNAFIAEVGEDGNKIVEMKDKFIVMSNFPNSDFEGKDYSVVSGTGADRYKIAYEYINSKKDNFNINDGLEVLKKTVQTKAGGWPTQCSILFDPAKNEAYVALKGDFNNIWKVAIDKGIMETFSGFQKSSKLIFDYNGITPEEMINPRPFSGFDLQTTLFYFIGILVLVIFLLSWLLGRRKKTKKLIW